MFNKIKWFLAGLTTIFLVFAFNAYGASVLSPYQGGTGTSSAPSYGQMLIGNSSGTYTLVASSTLGSAGTGTVTSIATTYPITGGTITTSGTISLSGMATSTITCVGATSCGSGSYVIGSPLTITSTGGGTVVGTVSTSTTPTIGHIPYWTSLGYPSLLGSTATTTLTENSLALSLSQPISVIGGTASVLSLATSSLFSYPWSVSEGGTSSTTLSGILKGAGTSAVVTAVNGIDYTLTVAQSCTNQVITALTAVGGSTCSSVSNTMLTNSTIGLTSSGSITIGTSPISLGGTSALNLNMANANTWTALQTFANASTTNLTASGYSDLGGVNIPTVYNTIFDPTGFPNFTTSLISFASSTRTFTIEPVSGSYDYYIDGVKYSSTTASSLIIPTTAGQLNYIYIDNATKSITQSATVWDFYDVQIATVYWNGTDGLIGFDRHGINMDWATHQYLHNTVGMRYQSGFTGVFNNANTFTMTEGVVNDEDNVDSVDATTTARILYRTPANGFTFDPIGTAYFKKTCATNHLCYDNSGTPTSAGTNNYVNYWVFGTNDRNTFIYVIMGQSAGTLTAARSEQPSSLSLGTLPFPEMKLLYKVILRDNATTYIETQDYRLDRGSIGNNFTATSHSVLTNLDYASSGHTGFAGTDVANTFTLLQSLNGNASTTQLTVSGNTYLATSGGSNFVGIGTTIPKRRLDLGILGTYGVISDEIGMVIRSADDSDTVGNSTVGLELAFRSGDTLDTNQKAIIRATRESTWGANVGLAFLTATGATPTEKLRILNNGNVGIGTSTPNYLLTVYGTSSTTIAYVGSLTVATSLTAPASFGGRSLTVNSTALDADTELYTRAFEFVVASSSVATTSSVSSFQVPTAITITQVSGYCKTGTTTIALDERATASPKTAGTDILTTPLAIGDYAVTTGFSNAGISAGAWVNLDIDGYLVASPQDCRINIKYTADD